MTGPKHARSTSKGRTYQHPRTGETAWSVTTILDGGLPKKALIGWAAKSVAEFAVANRARLDGMLSTVRLTRDETGKLKGILSDPGAVDAAVDWLKGAPYRDRERKADIGTAVHAEVEAFILGRPRPEPPEELAPHMAHFRTFLDVYRPVFHASEMTVWNRTESYAGTLDWIATIGGKTVLGDTKTGKGVYDEVALQLAAYQHAEFALLPDGTEEPIPPTDGCVVLHLTADGYSLIPIRTDVAVWDAFRYVREVFRFTDEIGKTCVGQPLAGPDGVSWTFAGLRAA